jgi:hypothetical protein
MKSLLDAGKINSLFNTPFLLFSSQKAVPGDKSSVQTPLLPVWL